eukprot:scaffold1464_cov149-Skeletonema_menzelii.AAC.28
MINFNQGKRTSNPPPTSNLIQARDLCWRKVSGVSFYEFQRWSRYLLWRHTSKPATLRLSYHAIIYRVML